MVKVEEASKMARLKRAEAGVGEEEIAAATEVIGKGMAALKKLLISCKRIVASFFLEEMA